MDYSLYTQDTSRYIKIYLTEIHKEEVELHHLLDAPNPRLGAEKFNRLNFCHIWNPALLGRHVNRAGRRGRQAASLGSAILVGVVATRRGARVN